MTQHTLKFTVSGENWKDIEAAARARIATYTNHSLRSRADRSALDEFLAGAQITAWPLSDGRWTAAVEVPV